MEAVEAVLLAAGSWSGSAFMLASLAVVGVTFLAWRGNAPHFGDALGACAMLTMSCAISNVLVALYTPPDCWRLFPLLDATCGAVAFYMWRSKPATWKLLLVALFVFQCCAHVAFRLQRVQTHDVQRLYEFVLNVSYAAQLVVSGWQGGSRVGLDLLDWLLGGARRSRVAAGGAP